MHHRAKDLTGKRFGRLVPYKIHPERKTSNLYWVCKCDCGNESIVMGTNMTKRLTTSCGCFHKENKIKHNMSKTSIYHIWQQMMYRCYYPKNMNYKYYGFRGIRVSKEWHDFISFYKDMGEKPENMSLDRINNEKDYCKSNCKWSTRKEQANNRRSNIQNK